VKFFGPPCEGYQSRARNYSANVQHFAEFQKGLARPYVVLMSIIQFDQHAERGQVDPRALGSRIPDAAPRRSPRASIVARAVALLREHVNEPVTMTELSRQTGVSERTLRAAFHDVLGRSPKQYAIALRLGAARQALREADPGTTTVTDVATAYGFFELGRFAGRYRDAFGEVPSQTLHQIVAPMPVEAA
jgi:transcriptional regulator GlxA family with amidase domain